MPVHQLQLLLRDWKSYRWALDRLLIYLAPQDIMRVTIAALESRDDRFAQLTHWLMDGDAPCGEHNDHASLDEAAKHGCWAAAEVLSRRMQRGMDHPINWNAEHVAVPRADSAFRRVMVAVTQTTYYAFESEVITAVAARGDLMAVHYMLRHVAVRYAQHLHTIKNEVFAGAAKARQFHITDWIATHSYCPDDCRYAPCAVSLDPLVEQFARAGDVEALKRLYARHGYDPSINAAIQAAAEGGHIATVEWILCTFKRSLEPSLLLKAAERGHLELLQWLWARHAMRDTSIDFVTAAAENGHAHVLRWLREHMDDVAWERQEEDAFWVAGEADELDVVRFFHEERGLELDVSFLKLSLHTATSVALVRYVLDRVEINDQSGAMLLSHAATHSNVDVVQYLVVNAGFWNCSAFQQAVQRGPCFWDVDDTTGASHSLEISRFLYAHAKVRAEASQTSLAAHIDVDNTDIFATAIKSDLATARWLAESVAEVDTGKALASGGKYDSTHLLCTPGGCAVVVACLRVRPQQCLGVDWLPHWAVRANCYEAFSLLVDMGHPDASSVSTCKVVTEEVRDSRFMWKLLAANKLPPQLSCIVPWAAEIGAESLLMMIDKQWGDALRALGRIWMRRAKLRAVQHGHVGVLQWLHDLVPREDEASDAKEPLVALLVRKAVKHERLECLRWLVDTLDIPADVVADALRTATTQRSAQRALRCTVSAQLVRWLTHPSASGFSTIGRSV